MTVPIHGTILPHQAGSARSLGIVRRPRSQRRLTPAALTIDAMTTSPDPEWLTRLREAAKQRPRTQFQKIRWSDLQRLLHERDLLLAEASSSTRETILTME